MTQSGVECVWVGRHLSMKVHGQWEFATRNVTQRGVGIVAITEDRRIVLVEQYRPPIGQTVVELPAGLAGDIPGAEHEELVEAARRELLEETGYVASRWTEIGSGYSSPGLTDESIVLFLAEGLERVGRGGGDGSESITVHEVALDDMPQWLETSEFPADLKLLAGLYAAQQELSKRHQA